MTFNMHSICHKINFIVVGHCAANSYEISRVSLLEEEKTHQKRTNIIPIGIKNINNLGLNLNHNLHASIEL